MGDAVSAGFATADALLMGRVLYDEWAAYWPEHADQPFGDAMNSIKKYVVRVRWADRIVGAVRGLSGLKP